MNEESDDELPANWQAGKTNDGHVFYINHQTQQTQWEHPVTNRVKVIPKGEYSIIRSKSSCQFVFC
jgi:predicted peptidase